ncbi:MAG: HNH endonuclease, partial [Microthrixaceae bacterium]
AINRLDVTGATETVRGLRTKGWKANRCHLPHRVVARDLRVGALLVRFEQLAVALGEAKISIDHVDAVAAVTNMRVETALLEVQDQIIAYACRHRFSHFKAWLTALVELLDEDGPEPDHRDHNTASMATDGQSLHLVMDLVGADAVVARRIIDTECDRQYRAAKTECETAGIEMPTVQQLRARAVIELLRRGADPDPTSPTAVTEAIVTLPVDRDGKPARVHTADGEPVDTATAAMLLCDALLQPVGVDPTGVPLNWGRRRRLFTPTQRTALGVRDGGCVFPGCDQPVSRCDAHHQQPWDTGGATDLVNGALLCRRHHRLEHSNLGWKLHTVTITELPAELAEQHRQRAAAAGLDPGDSAIDPGGSTSSGLSGNAGGTERGGKVRDGNESGPGDSGGSGCSNVNTVRIWTGPDGQTLLAQIAADHHPPPVTECDSSPGMSDPPPPPDG